MLCIFDVLSMSTATAAATATTTPRLVDLATPLERAAATLPAAVPRSPVLLALVAVAASLCAAAALPLVSFVAAFVRRSRALAKLGIPSPRTRSLVEVLCGPLVRLVEGDDGTERNFYREVLMEQWWMRDAKRAPLLRFRATFLETHYVVVADSAAAAAVLSASGAAELEKFTKHQHGIDLITSARGARSLLTLSSFSTEWRLIRKAVLPAFSLAAVRRRFERDILPSAEAGAEAVVQIWRAKRAADDAASADAAALAGGESSSPSPPRETTTTSVSVDVTELAVMMAMEVTTSLGFGLRSNVVERWGAAEASKIITAATVRQQEQGLDQDDNDAADDDHHQSRSRSRSRRSAL